MRKVFAAALIGVTAAAAALAVPVIAGAQAQTAPARPPAYAKCAACHSVVKGGPNGVGPNLHGIVGRKAGTVPKYSYSAALAKSGVTWNRQTLARYIADPDAVARGGKMPKIGTTPADREAIVAYLSGLK